MSVAVFWDTAEKLFIRQIYDVDWNWEDFLRAFDQTRKLALEVDYPIGLIAEVETAKYLPGQSVPYGLKAVRSLAPNIVLLVVITHSDAIRMLIRVVIRVMRFKKVAFAQNLEQARKIITAAIEQYNTAS